MSNSELKVIDNSNKWINQIEESIAKKQIKYYDYEHFNNIQEIGSGSSGKVYRANWKNSHNYLALKSFFDFNITAKEIINELELLREVDIHENIIHFYGITTETQSDNLANAISCLHNEEIMHLDLHSTMEILQGLREKPIFNTPEDYVKLYTECWNDEPDNRPTINQIHGD
ncbi:unnamed protein product [Rhizophagus irregularis]|nr:unnamed protein product [Rhizophagus irregularis]